MKRAVRALIRIIGAALIVFGGLELGLIYARHQEGSGTNWGQISIAALLIIGGLGLFPASARIAEKFTDDFEE